MITCARCKTENLEGSQYCDECGAPLRPNTRPGSSSISRSEVGSNGHRAASGNSQAPGAVGEETAPEIKLPAEKDAKPHAWLAIERGRSAGKQFMLSSQESQIGRWDADAGIFPDVDLDSDDPEAKVSRRHARIMLNNGRYFVEDLGSTNGTFINRGKRLSPGHPQPLREGDEIIVGKTFLRFHVFQ